MPKKAKYNLKPFICEVEGFFDVELKKLRKYKNVEIEKLKPYEKNARTHNEEQILKIVKSIEEFGFVNPVLIDDNFGIIAGHGRVLAAKKIGLKEIPCLFIEDLNEAKKSIYNCRQ